MMDHDASTCLEPTFRAERDEARRRLDVKDHEYAQVKADLEAAEARIAALEKERAEWIVHAAECERGERDSEMSARFDREKAKKEASDLREALREVRLRCNGWTIYSSPEFHDVPRGSDNGWQEWERKVDALLSAGEHDQEGR